MDYVLLIDKINKELEASGVNTIYTLIANNIDVKVIESLIAKNTQEYSKLNDSERKDLIKYIKGLCIESKLISIF